MRYLPAILIALGVAGAVTYALYLTRAPGCLWGLLVMQVAYKAIPFKDDEH